MCGCGECIWVLAWTDSSRRLHWAWRWTCLCPVQWRTRWAADGRCLPLTYHSLNAAALDHRGSLHTNKHFKITHDGSKIFEQEAHSSLVRPFSGNSGKLAMYKTNTNNCVIAANKPPSGLSGSHMCVKKVYHSSPFIFFCQSA